MALWARGRGREQEQEQEQERVQRLLHRVHLGRRLCRLLRGVLGLGLGVGLRTRRVLGLVWEGMEWRGVCLLLRPGLGPGELWRLERLDWMRLVRVLAVVRWPGWRWWGA